MARLLDSALPLVAAPMAGGPTTPALAAAVAGAGGFPFLAGGYLSPDAFAALLAEARPLGPFGVNLFLPQDAPVDREAFRRYADRLAPEAAALGVTLAPVPVEDDDAWPAKLDLLLTEPVPVVSTTFGLPDRAAVRALQRVGTAVLASVTTPAEAAAAQELGVDGLVAQGVEAGGHSARFDPRAATPEITLTGLVRAVAGLGLPVIAGGGVAGPADVRDLIAAGAESVAVGTLLLRCDESGTSTTHRDALADPAFTETMITHCFTGRPARALRNAFVDRHHAEAPYGYPALHHLTRDLRRAAARVGDPHRLHLWAGTGFRNARTGPAADIVRALAGRL